MVAGLLLSLNIDASKWGFILFFMGHVVLSGVFIRARDWPMVFHNVFFLFVDVVGIYRWFA